MLFFRTEATLCCGTVKQWPRRLWSSQKKKSNNNANIFFRTKRECTNHWATPLAAYGQPDRHSGTGKRENLVGAHKEKSDRLCSLAWQKIDFFFLKEEYEAVP